MPTGLSSGPQDAIAASRFSITVDGTEIAQFNELVGITSEVDIIDFIENSENELGVFKKLPGKRKPPHITLKRGKSTSMEIYAWHEAVIMGNIKLARRSGSIVLYDYDGKPVSRYHFHNGWPSKISLSGLKAGANEILMEEVTIVCERLERID
jgi:phage tail-like protein